MATFIKEEPLEIDELHNLDLKISQFNQEKSLIEKQFDSEHHYLNNINESVFLTDFDDSIDQIDNLAPFSNSNSNPNHNDLQIEDLINKINNPTQTRQPQKSFYKEKDKSEKLVKCLNLNLKQNQDQIALEKKKVLTALLESAKEKSLNSKMSKYEAFNLSEEARLLKKLDKHLAEEDCSNNLHELSRFRAKLELRSLKRKNHSKIFDIDSYVNELIDREKMRQNNFKIEPEKMLEDDELDDDVIFQSATLKTNVNTEDNLNDSACEVIEIRRVLDRFNHKKFKFKSQNLENFEANNLYHQFQMTIGMVESRNDDIKCLISPYTNKILKPYVWRDYKSLPIKLEINKKISEKNSSVSEKLDRFSIDYVHLRPEHVIQINLMCRQHFWAGIDISECLQYPDYSLVALYRKLIIGFAFLVPNTSHKEAYLSFIFVHPDWRTIKNTQFNNENVSIAQYMLYYLIQSSSDYDITLHVSVNSPAVLFYQKFGFEIEEFIKNFYDKYYSDDHNLSKDAFLMRLFKG